MPDLTTKDALLERMVAATDTLATEVPAALDEKAPLDSPAFTGTPTAPNPATEDDSTQIATTEWSRDVLFPLAGGTMTGNFTISQNPATITLKNSDFALGDTPTSDKTLSAIYFHDKSGNQTAALNHTVLADNRILTSMRANRNITPISVKQVILTASLNGTSSFAPAINDDLILGNGNYRWKEIYAITATINTSDERLKDNIEPIPNEVLDAWGEVNWYQFQFKSAIAEKGENARIHCGAVAQRIKSVFEAHDLDAFRYGLLCYDEWEADEEHRDENGELILEAQEAGNLYSLRYEEALCMEAAYQRRRADRIEARLDALEAKRSRKK